MALNIEIPAVVQDAFALGPSTLHVAARGYIQENLEARIAVPDVLFRLVERALAGSREHLLFLDRIIRGNNNDIMEGPLELAEGLQRCFDTLRQGERLIEIREENDDPEVSAALAESFNFEDFMIGMSPKRNFMAEYFKRVVSWSKQRTRYIIETTKENFERLGQFIVSMQIPDKLDRLITNKQELTNRVFTFKGGKTLRVFIGISVGIAGFAVTGPAAPVVASVGLGVAFIDP